MRLSKTILVTFFLLVTAASAQAVESKELVFLNWPDYMDPEILVEFEQRTGITVKQSYFDSDTARDELLLETEGKGFDVALINGASIRILAKRGWLERLDESSVPNLKHIDPRWRTEFEKAEDFGVPYFWGTIGIVYRQDLVPFAVSSAGSSGQDLPISFPERRFRAVNGRGCHGHDVQRRHPDVAGA